VSLVGVCTAFTTDGTPPRSCASALRYGVQDLQYVLPLHFGSEQTFLFLVVSNNFCTCPGSPLSTSTGGGSRLW
jgi:hypothetical protein